MEKHRFSNKEQFSFEDSSYQYWVESERYRDYKSTDTIYSLTQVDSENGTTRIDVINPVIPHQRVLISSNSSSKSEKVLEKHFPTNSFKARESDSDPSHPGVRVYDVPQGTRPLVGALLKSPFGPSYNKKIAKRAGSFLRKIYVLDSGIFDLDVTNIAVTPTESSTDDNVKFLIVPPLANPYKNRVKEDVEQRIIKSSGNLPEAILMSLIEGYRNGGK